MAMPLITITSDLGGKDPYSAALKGTLLSLSPGTPIIEISNEVSQFSIIEAAYLVKNVFRRFPGGSIHIIAVDPEGGNSLMPLIMEFEGHFFIAGDNGVLSLIRERNPAGVFAIEKKESPDLKGAKSSPALLWYAPAAADLASGKTPSELGKPHAMRESLWGEPTLSENALRGTILYIDRFGNCITNITKEEFLKIKGDRSFQIFIRNLRLQRIVSAYSDVARGEALAIFGQNGHLEIAMREGSAAQLLGIKVQDMLTVEFYE
jgi:S-adenosylmethionine hydrolase